MDRVFDETKTKYGSVKERSSFNPTFTQSLPVRRKTKTQRLVSGSKSLFRGKNQRKARQRGSDRRSSATLEPQAVLISPPPSPNWIPVQPKQRVPSQTLPKGSVPFSKRRESSSNDSKPPQKKRIVSTGVGSQPLQRQNAVYLSATSREEQSLAEDMKRRQSKLENMMSWPLEPVCGEMPNTAESSTEVLVAEEAPDSKPLAQESPRDGIDAPWGKNSETFYAQIDAMKRGEFEELKANGGPTTLEIIRSFETKRKPKTKEELEIEQEPELEKQSEIIPIPFDQGSIESLPLVELSPSKVNDPDYRGESEGSRAKRREAMEETVAYNLAYYEKWSKALDEVVPDIQEPTSTYTYIPVATGESGDGIEDHKKQRAEIIATISTHRSAHNPFRSSLDTNSDDGLRAAVAADLKKHDCDLASNMSTTATLASKECTDLMDMDG